MWGYVHFYTNSTFNECCSDICIISCQVVERCDGTVTVGFSVNPSELEEAIQAMYNGLQACFFALFQNLVVCSELNCEFCRNIVDIQDGKEIK